MNHSGLHAAAFEWPLLACEVAVFGLAAFAAIVNSDTASEAADTARTRIMSLPRWLALAALIWAPLDLLHHAAEMAAVSTAEAVALVPEILIGTHAGRIWMARLAVLAALAAVAWIGRPTMAKAARLMAVAAVVLMLRAMTSHAIDNGAIATALYLVHEACAGIWLGSLLGLWIGSRGAGAAWFAATAQRVSRAAAFSVAILAATGVYAAYDGLGPHLRNLVDSAYGRTLMLKLGIASFAVLLGGFNRFRLIPAIGEAGAQISLRNNVAAEAVILGIVLACSAALAALPPMH